MASGSDRSSQSSRDCSVAGQPGAIRFMNPMAPTMPDHAERQAVIVEATRLENLEARRTLDLLNTQADNMRAELAGLREKLDNVQQDLVSERSLQLQEANEKLILAALHAESIADAAVGSLGELARSIQRDTLTDTPNRAVVFDRTEHAIALAKRDEVRVAVLFIDLDDFKQINDAMGHSVGDATLQLVARRLESVVRTSDTVSRQGGDEFLVLMSKISQVSDAELVAGKILAAFGEPAEVEGHQISLSVSVGIAVYPEDGQDARTLIDRADAAMYRAKQQAGSSFRVINQEEAGLRDQPVKSDVLAPWPQGRVSARAELSLEMQHLREANEELVLGALTSRDMQDRAEAKHLRQVKFIAMVAHELRNPLNPIRNAAGLLKRVRNDQALLENLQGIIERQVVHMA